MFNEPREPWFDREDSLGGSVHIQRDAGRPIMVKSKLIFNDWTDDGWGIKRIWSKSRLKVLRTHLAPTASLKRNMANKFTALGFALTLSLTNVADAQTSSDQQTEKSDKALQAALSKVLSDHPKPSENNRSATIVWSQRADALFFLERFDEAVTEYEQMLVTDPSTKQSHWRLGIAYFFNNQPDKAVLIFEGYHSFDDVDRENGIWRYLSQYKASDAVTAKKELLRYKKDDRQPFPAVYRLFDGTMTVQQVLDSIPADASIAEREQSTFYIRLYCGMLAVVKKNKAKAVEHLKLAVACKWPQTAGFGPNYMWHVARIQLNQLTALKN